MPLSQVIYASFAYHYQFAEFAIYPAPARKDATFDYYDGVHTVLMRSRAMAADLLARSRVDTRYQRIN